MIRYSRMGGDDQPWTRSAVVRAVSVCRLRADSFGAAQTERAQYGSYGRERRRHARVACGWSLTTCRPAACPRATGPPPTWRSTSMRACTHGSDGACARDRHDRRDGSYDDAGAWRRGGTATRSARLALSRPHGTEGARWWCGSQYWTARPPRRRPCDSDGVCMAGVASRREV